MSDIALRVWEGDAPSDLTLSQLAELMVNMMYLADPNPGDHARAIKFLNRLRDSTSLQVYRRSRYVPDHRSIEVFTAKGSNGSVAQWPKIKPGADGEWRTISRLTGGSDLLKEYGKDGWEVRAKQEEFIDECVTPESVSASLTGRSDLWESAGFKSDGLLKWLDQWITVESRVKSANAETPLPEFASWGEIMKKGRFFRWGGNESRDTKNTMQSLKSDGLKIAGESGLYRLSDVTEWARKCKTPLRFQWEGDRSA